MRKLLLLFLGIGLAVDAAALAGDRAGVTLTPGLRAKLEALPHLHGRRVGDAGLEGKVVLVSFFASWCPPCNIEFKHLNDAHAAYYRKGLRIVAVNYFEDLAGFADGGARLDRFLGRHAPAFSVVRGTDDIAKAFSDVSRIPTVFVFDRRGRLALHFIHRWKAKKTNLTMAELHAALRPLLGPADVPDSRSSPRTAPSSRSGH